MIQTLSPEGQPFNLSEGAPPEPDGENSPIEFHLNAWQGFNRYCSWCCSIEPSWCHTTGCEFAVKQGPSIACSGEHGLGGWLHSSTSCKFHMRFRKWSELLFHGSISPIISIWCWWTTRELRSKTLFHWPHLLVLPVSRLMLLNQPFISIHCLQYLSKAGMSSVSMNTDDLQGLWGRPWFPKSSHSQQLKACCRRGPAEKANHWTQCSQVNEALESHCW